MGVAGCLEDAGHQVGVDPDAGRLGLHGDVAAGEHVAEGSPPAPPAGITAELDQRLPLRGTDAVQVEHVRQVVGGDPRPAVLQPVQLAGTPAEPLRGGFHRQAAAMAQPLDLADQAPSPDGRAVLHASLTSSRSVLPGQRGPSRSRPATRRRNTLLSVTSRPACTSSLVSPSCAWKRSGTMTSTRLSI